MAQPDRKTKLGERDHVLLAVLYNTVLASRRTTSALYSLGFPGSRCVFGQKKDVKKRISPLWPETGRAFGHVFEAKPRWPSDFLKTVMDLSASGVRFRLKQYLQAACAKSSSTPRETGFASYSAPTHGCSSPACLRVDATIRDWMGHVSLDTTNLYAQANLETKRRTLEKADGVLRPVPRHLVGSGARRLRHLDASEPVAHGQGGYRPTCRWPVRRNYDEQKRS